MHDTETATLAEAQRVNGERVKAITCPDPEGIGEILNRSPHTRDLAERLADPEWVALQRRKRVGRERRDAELQQVQRETEWERLAAKIGKRHAPLTLADFTCETDAQREALRAVQRFQSDLRQRIERGCNLLIFGPVGTGKDSLMTPLLRDAVRDVGASALWENGRNLWIEQRDWIAAKKRELALAQRYIRPRLLMLSDPSLEDKPLTDFQRDFLYRVIDERYRHCRSTWLTVNAADRAAMERQIGVATVDRLGQDCIAIHCNWDSYRRRENRRRSNDKQATDCD